ncbi:hypothetical protein N9L06_02195 [Mariniblastus sp.]|nr:hypothetical protein [Mariniblastus sp.]
MHFLRFAQYAILLMTAALIFVYVALTSVGYLVLVKMFGFGDGVSYSEHLSNEPLLPTSIATALCLTFLLEVFRVRLKENDA